MANILVFKIPTNKNKFKNISQKKTGAYKMVNKRNNTRKINKRNENYDIE